MITKIETAPDNVAAFRASGEVKKEDYDTIVIPAVDALVKKQGEINFMLILDTSLSNFSLGAFMKDLGVGLKHFTSWHKMAIISESAAINNFTDFFSYISPGEAKGFTHEQLDEANAWVSN